MWRSILRAIRRFLESSCMFMILRSLCGQRFQQVGCSLGWSPFVDRLLRKEWLQSVNQCHVCVHEFC